MKIDASCDVRSNARQTQESLRRICCSLFLVAAVVAAVGAVASPRVNQGWVKAGNALPTKTIVVTNTNDSGPGSLRQALVDVNDGDTIDFDQSLNGQKITLTSGQLNVDKDVTINGPGANNLAVDGNGQSREFYVSPSKAVNISGLTIKNGSSGIYNDDGALTLTECTVSGNSGIGIANTAAQSAATMTVSNCTVSGNSGSGIGNGGYGDSATMTVTDSTISDNSGSGISNGAAFLGSSAVVTVINSTISGNSSGGIRNSASNGPATVAITNSTVSGNSAVWGGGIFNVEGGQGSFPVVVVSNSTISTNSADYGGGIYNASATGSGATVMLSYSTISDNSAGQGGGVYNDDAGGSTIVDIGSTILKAGTLGENILNSHGTVTSHGYNLSSDDGGGVLTGLGDQVNTDPMLGPLQDNGGPTFTHALLPRSPAINAGDPNFTPPPFYDQRGRGFKRVVNRRIDIGSFEVQVRPTIRR